jgi:hypothetical protein
LICCAKTSEVAKCPLLPSSGNTCEHRPFPKPLPQRYPGVGRADSLRPCHCSSKRHHLVMVFVGWSTALVSTIGNGAQAQPL